DSHRAVWWARVRGVRNRRRPFRLRVDGDVDTDDPGAVLRLAVVEQEAGAAAGDQANGHAEDRVAVQRGQSGPGACACGNVRSDLRGVGERHARSRRSSDGTTDVAR